MSPLIAPLTDHPAAAALCQAAAGAEVLIAEYPSRSSAETVARGIRHGLIRAYRPAGSYDVSTHPSQGGTSVWARYTGGADVEALPTTLTVRVPDYGNQVGYEGVKVVTVEISARCLVCGGPRGEVRPDPFIRDGVRRERDAWSNPCGHEDTYGSVLLEAERRRTLGEGTPRAGRPRAADRNRQDVRGVEGGQFCTAVDLIAAEIDSWPWVSSLRILEVLDQAGEHAAADAIRVFRANSLSGGNTSAKSAALYLIHCDRQELAAGTTAGSSS